MEGAQDARATDQRFYGWPAALLLLLILLFFHEMVFSNLILARGDTFLYFYPYWNAASDALHRGRVPLWNPSLFMGAPFLANSQVGFFYPLNWPLWLLLPTPYAVSASIVVHVGIATLGAYILARRRTGMSITGAWLAGLLFGLGGYLTSQVEHVNQLQGLAWLPWLLFVVQGNRLNRGRKIFIRKVLYLGFLFALQLLAGHVQTLFISAIGLLVWTAVRAFSKPLVQKQEADLPQEKLRWRLFSETLPLIAGGGLALLLAAAQLLPTLQLTQYSSRQGGLPMNEVLSFSLHPLLLGQALLPHSGQTMFTEYVSFLPLTALLLAWIGAWQWRRDPHVRPSLALAVVGFAFALGRFNPLYIVLAYLPGFSFFRAPARWQVLYALGIALLAARGWKVVSQVEDGSLQRLRQPLRAGIVVLLGLIGLHFLAVPLATFIPVGPEAPVEFPNVATASLWLVELALASIFLYRPRRLQPQTARAMLALPLILIPLILFLASRTLPYNNLTTPSAYFDLRPPMARLKALGNCDLLPSQCQQPPGRLLSLSGIFELGDEPEMKTIYGDQLPPEALYDYVVAAKQKEVLTPNLPMAFGLTSIDGFDGGILPLQNFINLVQLLLPADVIPVDGRLQEYLTRVPEARWLDLFNARYLITDKVGDEWHRGVFFDLQHPLALEPGATVDVEHLPQYEATGLWLLAHGTPGYVHITTTAGDKWELQPEQVEDRLWQVEFTSPVSLRGLQLQASMSSWYVQGLTLVDQRDESFQPLTLGAYRLIYSGDVKIYENMDVLPRAFLVHRWHWQPDVDAAAMAMMDAQFDPATSVILVGQGEPGDTTTDSNERVTVERYEPEQVVVEVETAASAVLVLTDAYYPGWQATVAGQEVPIYQADGLFRAVMVPEGEHEIVFTYRSQPFLLGRIISIVGLSLWGALFLFSRSRQDSLTTPN